MIVVDTSAVLCWLWDEPGAVWIADRLADHHDRLLSAVILTEISIKLRDQMGEEDGQHLLADKILSGAFMVEPVSQEQALIAAEARISFNSLNLGDCFVFALAASRKIPLLTCDLGFDKTSLPRAQVLIPPELRQAARS